MNGFLASRFLLFGITGVSALAVSEQKIQVLRSLTEDPPYLIEGSLVSIVVPALQEEKYLPNLLTSIQHQTYTPIEVIVVDQSPTESYEATQEICQQYGAKLIHLSEPNVSLARNTGAQAAASDILVFSDADNILAHTCVEDLVKTLEQGYILANPVYCMYDDGLGSFGVLWVNNWLKSSSRTLGCVAIQRDAYLDIGGYDESCDPVEGCREDLKLGRDIVARFGQASTKLVRSALVGTSARRWRKEGYSSKWKSRTVRKLFYIRG